MSGPKYQILVADDSEMNRAILSEILSDEYELLEAEDGLQAIAVLEKNSGSIALVLLDIMMPGMDGLQVLAYMNEYHWIDDVPVVMISAETDSAVISKSYVLGASDYINRPFDASVVRRRVENTLALYAKQRRLAGIVAEQMYQKTKSSSQMIAILSHIVEFRNGESGLHVLHMRKITEMLLRRLAERTDKYNITREDVERIGTASTLHDIGKISVPEEILNKPGRLTPGEFAIIKKHPAAGAAMLGSLPYYQDDPLMKAAYEICRWHHERYDGKGYPDGLVGDEIPISAQVVALADVYDALTSERSYKPAYPHEEAIRMILNGECGCFSQELLDCLVDVGPKLRKELHETSQDVYEQQEIRAIASEMLHSKDLNANSKILCKLECERIKTAFFAAAISGIPFTYQFSPPLLSVQREIAATLGLKETVFDPLQNTENGLFDPDTLRHLLERAKKTSQEHPNFHLSMPLRVKGQRHWYRCQCRAMWVTENEAELVGIAGILSDLEEEYHSAEQREKKMAERALRHVQHGGGTPPYRLDRQQVQQMCRDLSVAFDVVRLVDRATDTPYVFDETGALRVQGGCCFAFWGRENQCEHCISGMVSPTRNKLTKFELAGDDLYHMVSMYVEMDGKPYALEMVARISDETLLDGYGKGDLVELIASHNKKLYTDPVTGIYNRCYYEEQLYSLSRVAGVAMLDFDDFKAVNDTYGHHVGDLVLRAVAEQIQLSLDRVDAVARYGGDEFIIVFREADRMEFDRMLDKICRSVEGILFPEWLELHLSVSIGGKFGPGPTSELVYEADRLLYQAKKEKNCVVTA